MTQQDMTTKSDDELVLSIRSTRWNIEGRKSGKILEAATKQLDELVGEAERRGIAHDDKAADEADRRKTLALMRENGIDIAAARRMGVKV